MAMRNDYRVMDGEIPFGNIKERKEDYYSAQIKIRHPRTQNHFNILSKKEEKRSFGEKIYNKKCAYCGVPTYINDVNNYEIDHFKNEAHNKNFVSVNKIENLVYACHDCNRAKSDFDFSNEYEKILDPDSDMICEIFCCDDDLNIRISDKYSNDQFIISYYKQMKFGNERRKLDRILIILKMKIDKTGDPNGELNKIFVKVLEKRNETNF